MYWEGNGKAAENSSKTESSFQARINVIIASPVYSEENVLPINIPGLQRKIALEQEFLMTTMRLRLELLTKDHSFRFKVSPGRVSQISITWFRLMSKELRYMIIWPSKGQIFATLQKHSNVSILRFKLSLAALFLLKFLLLYTLELIYGVIINTITL